MAGMDDDGLGWRFWGGLLAAIVAIGFGLLLFFVLLSGAFYRWGALGALIAFGGVLIFVGWIYDRRHARDYE
jgi:uncharacterized membrane protein HdeD (DUF308 family)